MNIVPSGRVIQSRAVVDAAAEEETAVNNNEARYAIDADIQGSKNANFTLRSWAKFLLQRHW